MNITRTLNRTPALLSIGALALALAGCASQGDSRTHAVQMDASAVVSAASLDGQALSPAGWPQVEWWQAYGDPQLDALMRTALAGQPSIRVAEARFRQAQAASGVARSALFPQVGATARSTEQRFSENGPVSPALAGEVDSINEINVGLSYELDLWGKNRAALEASLDRAHAAEVDAQAARLVLTSAVARTYLALDLAYAQRDIANATLKQREQLLALTSRRVQAHLDSQVELTQAEAALPATRQEILALTEVVTRLENQLALLSGQGPDMGRSIQRPHLGPLPAATIPSNLPAELIGRRPDVVAARWRVEAASGDITVAKAQFYPNISLNAFAGVQSVGLDDLMSIGSRILGIGPAISLPIFNGGRLRSALGVSQASYDIAVEQYNGTLVAAIHDVVEQLVVLRSLEQQVKEQEAALALSEKAWELASARYRHGLATYLQVLSSEGQVLAQRRLANALKSRQAEGRMNLDRALGGGALQNLTAPSAAHNTPSKNP